MRAAFQQQAIPLGVRQDDAPRLLVAVLKIGGVDRRIEAEVEGKILACLRVFTGKKGRKAGRAVVVAKVGQCLKFRLALLCGDSSAEIILRLACSWLS
ncbi:hypothetical protein [Streptomyces cyaneofuscatus]|uniref:hypothetical protein n=1 Tax=Streptomyces cyaneofuscatus TaxID=66883 RepID=UPI0037B3BABF